MGMGVAILEEPWGLVESARQWAADAVSVLGREGLLLVVGIVAAVAAVVILWMAWRAGRIRRVTRKVRRGPSAWSLGVLRAWARELVSLLSTKRRYEVPLGLVLGGDRSLGEGYVATLTQHGSSRVAAGAPKTVDQGVFGWGDKGELCSLPMQVPLDERRFVEGLRSLADYRPERPADSVVLNLPVAVLRGSDEALEAHAQSLCAQLQLVQKEWGFRLPIYVVVCGMEELEGFSGFLASRAAAPHEMFGWSGALLPEGQPEAQQCSAAVESLQERLLELQLMQPLSPAAGSRDDVFMFPLCFDALIPRLQKALMLTFTASVYHARDEVRGLYFAASTPWAASSGATDRAPLTFVRDLLEKKVFAEHHLGRPLARGVLSRNRTLRRAQLGVSAIAVVGFSVLAYQAYTLEQQVDNLAPALERMAGRVADAKRLEGDPTKHAERLALAQLYVQELPELEGSRLARISMPLSFVYGLDARLADELSSDALPNFIFPVMACAMQEHGEALAEVKDSQMPKAAVPRIWWLRRAVAFLEHLDRIQHLSRRDSDTVSLDDEAEGTTTGHHSPSLQMFSELVEYTLEYRLEDRFYEASDLYRKALSDTSYPLEIDEDGSARCRLNRSWAETLAAGVAAQPSHEDVDRHWDDDPHERALARIERWSEGDFEGSGETISLLVDDVEHLRELATKGLNFFFSGTGSGAGSSGEAGPCHELRSRVEALKGSVGESAAKPLWTLVEHQASEQQCEPSIRKYLLSLQYPWIGNLFVEKPHEATIVVNPKLERLVAGLRALEGTELARAELDDVRPRTAASSAVVSDYAGAPQGAGGMDFVWDVPELKQALRYDGDYRDFLEKGCTECGPEVQGLVRRIAVQAIDNAVVAAQVPLRDVPPTLKFVAAQREAELAQRVDAIRPALEVMVELRGVYGRLRSEGGASGLTPPRENFTNLAHLYVMSQLRELTHLANEDSRLYQPTATPDWSQPHAAAALFGLADRASVDEYLTSQLNRVQYLAGEYADPLLVYLGTGEAAGEFTEGGDVTLWRETLVQLDELQRADPTNAADQLRKLFVEQLLLEGEDRCKAAPPASAPASGVDIFSRAYAELVRHVDGRCRGEVKAAEEDVRAAEEGAYAELAEDFNERLAWHYPFVTSAKQTKREADPAEVVAFFEDHPIAGTDLLESVERSDASETKKKAVLRFLRGLAEVEAMVKRTLAPPKGSPRGVGLETEFRVNREQSKLSENILHWVWKVGEAELEYPHAGEPALVRWEAGMPLSLSLQWATGSDMRPKKLQQCPRTETKVKGLRGTFSAGGKWALLRLLDCYRAERGDADAVVLGFETLLAYLRVGGEANARVFLRLRFVGVDPETKEAVPVVIPERFPAFAPSL